MRCARYGSEEQQKACADRLIQQEQDYKNLVKIAESFSNKIFERLLNNEADGIDNIVTATEFESIMQRGYLNGYILQ